MATETKEKPTTPATEKAVETITPSLDAAPEEAGADDDTKISGVPDGYVPKAEYEKVVAERDKHRKEANDFRSSEIQKLKEFNRGGTFEDLREDLLEVKGALTELAKGGNVDAYMERAASARTEKEKQAVDSTFTQRHDEAEKQIFAVADELKVDPDKHEAFEATRVYIRAARRAVKTGRPDGIAIGFYLLGQSVAEAERAKFKVLTGKHEEALKAEYKRGQKDAARLAEKDAALDTSTGPAGAAGGKTRYTRAELAAMSPTEYAEARKHILK